MEMDNWLVFCCWAIFFVHLCIVPADSNGIVALNLCKYLYVAKRVAMKAQHLGDCNMIFWL